MPIDIKKCWVDWYPVDFDQRAYICRQKDYDLPLGVVIGKCHYIGIDDDGSAKKAFFEVKLSYVTEWARRRGVRKLINDVIFEEFPVISTTGFTDLGHKFMKSQGYKKSDLLGWTLHRKDKKRGKNEAE
jgi:hypothetical protein